MERRHWICISRSSGCLFQAGVSTSIPLLFCASAAGQSIPPLIIFNKSMPAGCKFQDEDELMQPECTMPSEWYTCIPFKQQGRLSRQQWWHFWGFSPRLEPCHVIKSLQLLNIRHMLMLSTAVRSWVVVTWFRNRAPGRSPWMATRVAYYINKIWWLCLVPTSTNRFASDVGYRLAKNE